MQNYLSQFKKPVIKNFAKEIKDLKKKDDEIENLELPFVDFSKEGLRLANDITKVEKQNLDYKHLNQLMLHEVLTALANVKNDTHTIKQGQSKFSLIVLAVVFIAGLLIGSQYAIWLPYISDIVNTVQNASNLKKEL